MRIAPFVLVALVGLCVTATGESWAPYTYKKHESPDRRTVLHTAKGEAGGLAWRLVHHEAGPPADGAPSDRSKNVARGEFVQLPWGIHVLDGAAGVVFFEQYGAPGVGFTLARMRRDGSFAFRHKRGAVLPAKALPANRPIGGNWVWRAWWVDEQNKRAILITRHRTVRIVHLETGAVSKGVLDDEVARAAQSIPHARTQALLLALSDPLVKQIDKLKPLVNDKAVAPMDRLRAALVLDHRKLRALTPRDFEIGATDPKMTRGDRNEWVTHAARSLSAEKAHALFEGLALRAKSKALRETAVYGLQLLGTAEAGATVVRLISHAKASQDVRDAAMRSASQMKPEVVLGRVLRDLRGAEHDVASATRLLHAAFALDPDGLSAKIAKEQTTVLNVFKSGRGPTDFLILYFAQHPTTEAVKPLLGTLKKYRNNDRRRQIAIIALRECTGQDYGDDVDAWLAKTVGK